MAKEEEKKEEGTEEEGKQQEWDKEKQRADQLEANLKKKQEQLDYALGRVADNEQKLQQAQAQLKEVKEAQKSSSPRMKEKLGEEYGQPLLQVVDQ